MIAKEALAKKTGARALRNIMEKLLLDMMFEAHEQDDIERLVLTVDDKCHLLIKGFDAKGKETFINDKKAAQG